MKFKYWIILAVFFISGCMETKTDYRQIQNINGLVYLIGETKPFSGIALGAPMGFTHNRCDISYEDGKIHGKTECYDSDNKIVKYINYKNEKVHGWERYFNDGGEVIHEIKYKNNLKDGEERVWNQSGDLLIKQINFNDGNQVGVERSWSEDGVLKTDLIWSDGKKTGVYFGPEMRGTKEHWLNGLRHGAAVHGFSVVDDGAIDMYEYSEGKIVSKYSKIYSKGVLVEELNAKPSKEGEYIKGEHIDTSENSIVDRKVYSSVTGKLIYKVQTINRIKNAAEEVWDANGKLVMRCNWNMGVLDGEQEFIEIPVAAFTSLLYFDRSEILDPFIRLVVNSLNYNSTTSANFEGLPRDINSALAEGRDGSDVTISTKIVWSNAVKVGGQKVVIKTGAKKFNALPLNTVHEAVFNFEDGEITSFTENEFFKSARSDKNIIEMTLYSPSNGGMHSDDEVDENKPNI